MIRLTFAAAVVALVFAALPGASQAAPIAPIPAAVASDALTATSLRYGGVIGTGAAGIVASKHFLPLRAEAVAMALGAVADTMTTRWS